MTQRLTQEELAQIVTEVESLQTRREAELDQQQVKEILQEMNLPPELLDEAIVQLHRRQALSVQQRQNRWITSGVVALLAVVSASTIFVIQQQNSALARVSAQQDRITSAQNNSSNLNTISRQNNAEVFYRVTLKDAPLGKKLTLSCNWLDPKGKIVKQNNYQTREINTSVWNTQCRHTINSAATVGKWQVQMFLEGRQISNETFQVN
ncbi:hypothetical protein VF14_18190 [Nostoc linckia z18]|jgi:hypothetical protein|uniref:DUF3859 domain-containing protein n=2 Tax=Nostoc linckia TaxID=92942 RepID=A0A9Q5ZBN7_NOSLI|nr:DUF3859 domain-containing protein [Nostoc linckia]PHK39070.1 hypothetical protein VF13_34980 [Nostoc linckia z16]PHK41202.1 hypothetical protein VF12_07410 [Nostoc linckia z15]PHJ62407.1 hypothetical protein VF02_17200 [Nostoc linckia z1]PHJ62481.1 hypothetical protein VF05_26335 [Nostoc linckia z3]PHJ71240.1 hypothetical protein VF03_20395 [Nostoc linckia z2]